MIVSNIDIKLQFPYVVLTQYEHHTAASFNNATVHKNSTNVALCLAKYFGAMRRQHDTKANLIFGFIMKTDVLGLKTIK